MTVRVHLQDIESNTLSGAALTQLQTLLGIVAPAALWPIGSIFISAVTTNPATLLGFGTWSAIGAGKVLIGLNGADPDFTPIGATGGAKTVASTGSVAAPTFTGNSVASSLVSAGTPAGTNDAPTITGHTAAITAGTPAGTNSTVTVATASAAVQSGSGVNHFSTIATVNPGSAFTVGAQTFTGSALATHQHNAGTLGIVAPVFTGSALATHQHTTTATGTNSAPAFTGSASSVVQPYLVVSMWQRTA